MNQDVKLLVDPLQFQHDINIDGIEKCLLYEKQKKK
jgi:hypothetical protein